MTAERPQFRSPMHRPEALGAEFDSAQREADDLVSRMLRSEAHDAAPSKDLSRRIFEMTASMLPSADASTDDVNFDSTGPLRMVESHEGVFVVGEASRYRFTAWARLALAASVLLAAGVTWWMTSTPTPAPNPIARNSPPAANALPSVRLASLDFNDLNSLAEANPSVIDNFQREVAYLLDASDVRSINDLNDDLVLLVQQMEM